MKKILLLMMVAVLSSCTTVRYFETTNVLNLKEYTGDDFSINPSPIANGDFVPLGTVSNYFNVGKPSKDEEHKIVNKSYKMYGMVYEDYDVSFDYMIKKTIEDVKAIGGNGIIDFRFDKVYDKQDAKKAKGGYVITGIAVRYK